MKAVMARKVILGVGFIVILLISGCEEQLSHNQDNVVAAEKIQLKDELEQCRNEINKQQELLRNCQKEKQALADRPTKQYAKRIADILESVVGENQKLKAENKQFKQKIEELKKISDEPAEMPETTGDPNSL